ncbi:MAG: asparagine synthetase B family protein [Vicinamibacterales bacterium]
MSGTVGIVHFDGCPVDPRDLARMALAASDRAVDGRASWIDRAAAIEHQYFHVTPESMAERQPLVSRGVVLSFDGRLDNRQELIDRCGDVLSPAEGLTDPALALAAYRVFGDRCFGHLIGDFAVALFDARRRRVLLARDLMAARPLYYAFFPGRVIFASAIESLLAHAGVATKPDEDGLADLVLNGCFDGHRTWFDGVWSVPPGSVVTVSAERATVVPVSDLHATEIRYSAPDEYVEHFGALFTQSVRRRLRSAHPVAVAVSGGVDSSAILCAAARQGEPGRVRGFTLAFPSGTAADERPFIEALQADGLHVDEIPVDRIRLLMGAEGRVAGTEMPRLMWDGQDALLAAARRVGCRVILDGFFGDQLLAGQAYLVDLVSRGRIRTLTRHLAELPLWLNDETPQCFRRRFRYDMLRAAVPGWLMPLGRRTIGRAQALRRYPDWYHKAFRRRGLERALDRSRRPRSFPSHHARQCWQNATSGYYRASMLQATSPGVAHGLDTAYPFGDRDLVSFVASIPGDVVNRGGVMKAILRQAMRGIMPDAIRLRRSKADFTAVSNRAVRAEQRTLSRLLDARSLSVTYGFVDIDVLRSRMPEAFTALAHDAGAQLGWQISDTLALELWLRRFFGGHSTERRA